MFDEENFDEAKQYAEEQISLMPQFEGSWNYGNTVEDVNLVLGRIAVKQSRIDDAKRYLLLAGNITGFPQVTSFGPNMSFTLDLLNIGEREAVLLAYPKMP